MTSRPARFVLFLLAAAVLAPLLGVVDPPPRPSTRNLKWSLEFTPGDLRLYVDDVDGLAYWFFTYKVVNETGEDRKWAPSFVLFTDTGDIVKSGQDVPTRVTDDLINLMGNELLERQYQVIGDLLQGERYAKEGLVIWPARSTTVNEMRMFIGGLSGETARVHNPLTNEEIILRKTMQRDHLAIGDMLARGTKPVPVVSQRWVMR